MVHEVMDLYHEGKREMASGSLRNGWIEPENLAETDIV
jgi:hypothetical protein